jgi:hypothetical protein
LYKDTAFMFPKIHCNNGFNFDIDLSYDEFVSSENGNNFGFYFDKIKVSKLKIVAESAIKQ